MLVGGQPGGSYDADFWRALHALQDRTWPGMAAQIEVARSFGAHWEQVTTPFVWVERGRALSHVGVIAHPVRLAGVDRVVAGVHAVCTHPEARGQGLGRRCMEAALAWIDTRFDLAKLATDIPDYYAKWGFSVVPTHRFVARRSGGGGPARPATAADRERVRALLAARDATSSVYATAEPGWLPVIDLALDKRLPGGMWLHPDRDTLLVGRVDGDTLHLHDVVAPVLPSLDEVLAAVPERFERVVYGFTPDRLDPEAVPVPVPVHEGVMQVRGAWPRMPPFGVSPVWEH